MSNENYEPTQAYQDSIKRSIAAAGRGSIKGVLRDNLSLMKTAYLLAEDDIVRARCNNTIDNLELQLFDLTA